MANSAFKISPAIVAGLGVAVLVLGSAATLGVHADTLSIGRDTENALRFTLLQAAVSAVLATALAVPVARALFRRQFRGRGALIVALSAPFVLPTVAAVMALLSIFGRQGPVNDVLAFVSLPPVSIFGLQGVVLANVFLNLPLAVRMLLQAWQRIPAERFRLAQSLGMAPASQFRHLEAPMLGAQIPAICLVIFLLCLSSFSIALMLGGGPGASTLELAVYQSLRFDFDLGRAATLALTQFVLCAVFTALARQFTLPEAMGRGLDRSVALFAPKGWRRFADGLWIAIAALFLLSPMAAIVVSGVAGVDALPAAVWPAAARSVGIAVLSATLASALALIFALQVARRSSPLVEFVAMVPMASSSLVLGTGLFLWVRPLINPELVAVPVTAITNAVLALPFVFRILLPAARTLDQDYHRLAVSLGLKGWARWRFLTLPRLARPLGFGAGLAAALSMGDLGVIAIFSGGARATLPLEVQRLMGSYQMDGAAAAALLLIALSIALFWAFDRLGEYYAAA